MSAVRNRVGDLIREARQAGECLSWLQSRLNALPSAERRKDAILSAYQYELLTLEECGLLIEIYQLETA